MLVIEIILLLTSLIAHIISRKSKNLKAEKISALTFIAFCLLFALVFFCLSHGSFLPVKKTLKITF